METLLAGRPPIKIGGEWRPRGKGPHDDVEVRVAYTIFHTDVLSSFLYGVDVSELRITNLGDVWRLMLKGDRKRQPVIAFFYAETWQGLFTLMATSLDSGAATFYQDIYPPKSKPKPTIAL